MKRHRVSPVTKVPRSDLAKLVQSLPTAPTTLGLTHITSAYSARGILESGAISAIGPCPVLNEDVFYTFYGRAAFRSGDGNHVSHIISQFPVVFIIDPDKIPQPKYVFAFDSGAFMTGRMDDYVHQHMPLFDFLLAPDVKSAARLVHAMFGDADQFLANSATGGLNFDASNFEAECYERVVRAGNSLDDRASTPEIVFADPISISHAVTAAVLPDALAADPAIEILLRDANVEVLPYRWVKGSRPTEHHMQVRLLVEQIYRSRGWLT